MSIDMTKAIETLRDKAMNATDSGDALRFSQAATNLANANATDSGDALRFSQAATNLANAKAVVVETAKNAK